MPNTYVVGDINPVKSVFYSECVHLALRKDKRRRRRLFRKILRQHELQKSDLNTQSNILFNYTPSDMEFTVTIDRPKVCRDAGLDYEMAHKGYISNAPIPVCYTHEMGQ